jgi:pimeloyl-ACP methyl ester carboxylesterase
MRQAAERVSALALLNTNARADSKESTENRRRLLSLAQRDFEEAIKTLMAKLLIPQHLADPAITATIAQMARAVGPEAFARQQEAIIGRIDSRPHLAKIDCPTLVLAAREDAVMTIDVHEEMANAIPGAKLVIVEACGHMSTLERPEEVTDALHLWLTGEPRRGIHAIAGTTRTPPS